MHHLIQGDDEYLVAVKRDELQASFLRDGDATIEHLDGTNKKTDLTSLFQSTSTLSFFETRKIVILENASEFFEREKKYLAKKAGMKILEDTLSVGDDVLLILCSYEKRIAKNTRVYKMISQMGKVTELKRMWHDPNEGLTGDLQRWVRAETAKRKLNLSAKQQNMLVARVGSDLRQIANELDKLKVYLDDDPVSNLDAKTLAHLVPPSRELIIFNLIDAVAQKNCKRALAFVKDLTTSGLSESHIIMMLHRQLRQIYSWRILAKREIPENDITAELGLTPFTTRKLKSQIGKFPTNSFPRIISALILADEEVKSSSMDKRFILEKLIIRLTG
ncbi:DNA polymerase III subunit delta [bacterium]|nr:DNA polymerase III subunit delta [bacterium]